MTTEVQQSCGGAMLSLVVLLPSVYVPLVGAMGANGGEVDVEGRMATLSDPSFLLCTVTRILRRGVHSIPRSHKEGRNRALRTIRAVNFMCRSLGKRAGVLALLLAVSEIRGWVLAAPSSPFVVTIIRLWLSWLRGRTSRVYRVKAAMPCVVDYCCTLLDDYRKHLPALPSIQ